MSLNVVTTQVPLPDESCRFIFSSHMLEHLGLSLSFVWALSLARSLARALSLSLARSLSLCPSLPLALSRSLCLALWWLQTVGERAPCGVFSRERRETRLEGIFLSCHAWFLVQIHQLWSETLMSRWKYPFLCMYLGFRV